MTPLRLEIFGLILIVACAGCAPPHAACTSLPAAQPDCYLVQLHLHGHSNHNGNAFPASMESHTAEAVKNGFDVVWWTDHADLYNTFSDIRLDFTSASADSAGAVVLFGARLGRQLSTIKLERTGEGEAGLEQGRLVIKAGGRTGAGAAGPAGPAASGPSTSGPSPAWASTARISPASKLGKVHTVNFCRPVTSGLKLDAWLAVEGLTPDTYVRVGFDFSWHPDGQHHAVFDGVEGGGRAPRLVGDTTVVAEFEVPREVVGVAGDVPAGAGQAGARVTFDLEQVASLLPRGADNTLSSFYIEVGARSRQAIRVAIDSLVIRSDKPGGASQVGAVDSLARAYRDAYGLGEYVGVEVGGMHTPERPHMNAYYPDEETGYQRLDLETRGSRLDWVDSVHRKGGLVSFNHPFGAHRNARGQSAGDKDSGTSESGGAEAAAEAEDYEDASPTVAPRVLARNGPAVSEDDFWEVAEPLLRRKGLGADMLEVGYLFRGLGSLDDHLRLWDLALAHGIRLVGTGVSDSHGGAWGSDMIPNPFASWIWAPSAGAADLLAAIKRGRVAFGDPFLWKSALAFSVQGEGGRAATMGDTLYFSGRRSALGQVRIEPGRDDVEVRVVRVKMKQAREVDKSVEVQSAAAAARGFSVAVGESCYVRVEIYAKDGTPLVFTNPIFLFPGK